MTPRQENGLSDAAPTAAQIREAIDAGRTGEKVAFPDHAAAPLGADEEAAGHPPSPAELRMTAEAEIRDVEPEPDLAHNPRGGPSNLWLGAAVGVAAACGVAAVLVAVL